MSTESLMALSVIAVIPVLALLGKFLQYKLGAKSYQDKILPIINNIFSNLFSFRGNIFSSALDPREWKTDKKSLILIFVGLPLGLGIMIIIILGLSY